MLSPADKMAARELAAKVADMERRLRALERSPQLARSSITDGALEVYTATGQLTMVVGKQFDGSQGAVAVAGPVPNRPSQPVVRSFVDGVSVKWDGQYGDTTTGATDPALVASMDWARVDVVASQDPDAEFTVLPPLASITSPRGGQVMVALDPGDWYVGLVTRTTAGKASIVSLRAMVTVEPVESILGVSVLGFTKITALSTPVPANMALPDPDGYVPGLAVPVVGRGTGAYVTVHLPSLIHDDPTVFVFVTLTGPVVADEMVQLAIAKDVADTHPGNTISLTAITDVLEPDVEYEFNVGFRTAAGGTGTLVCSPTYPGVVLVQGF